MLLNDAYPNEQRMPLPKGALGYATMLLNDAYPNEQRMPLPKSALGYATNNQYKDSPPIMNDGRALVACWQPEAVVNNQIIEKHDIRTNWEYRNYMISNALSIMDTNRNESLNDVGYYVRVNELPSIQAQIKEPYLFKSLLDETQPLGYDNTDMKQHYLSKEQLNARKTAASFAI
jgi:hypothetical protein